MMRDSGTGPPSHDRILPRHEQSVSPSVSLKALPNNSDRSAERRQILKSDALTCDLGGKPFRHFMEDAEEGFRPGGRQEVFHQCVTRTVKDWLSTVSRTR